MIKSLFPDSMLNSSSLTLEDIMGKLTWFHEMFHLVHFQTSGYAEHQATGAGYEYIHSFKDGFLEKLMGYTGRRVGPYKIDPVSLSSAMLIASDAMNYASTLKQYAETNGYLDIGNLADEFSGEMAKIKFLLTLS
jgi:hypothetical protein